MNGSSVHTESTIHKWDKINDDDQVFNTLIAIINLSVFLY